MEEADRRTLRNGLIGGIGGAALGVVPIVLLVAPFLGGALAGFLDRDGPRRGALAGAIAGLVMAAIGTLVTGVVLFVRFGDLPFTNGAPVAGLGIAALLSLGATIGQVIVAGIGGALGALIADEPSSVPSAAPGPAADSRPRRRWLVALGSLVVGLITFLGITLAVTVVLDPFIWPSALVGLPTGVITGSVIAVLAYRWATRRPGGATNWRTVGLGILAVAVAFGLLLGGLSVLGQDRIEQTRDSTYSYAVTLAANQTLENVTVYVPVPAATGDVALGERFVQDVTYSRENPAIEGYVETPAPVNFTYALPDTVHGRMLAISADRIDVSRVYYREVENETVGWRERIDEAEYDPTDPSMGVQHDGTFTFTVTAVADQPIETAAPVGAEPVFDPRYDQQAVDCSIEAGERHRCFAFESRVYASYEASATTTVVAATELSGRNEWFAGGWTGNEYRQRTLAELQGPGSGWYETSGDLEVGVGRYPE